MTGEARDGWEISTLGEICQINPPRNEIASLPDDLDVSFVPMAAVSVTGRLLGSETRKAKEVKKGFPHFKERDVLVAKITPCFENGKRWLAESLVNGVGFGSTEFHVLRATSRVLPEWIYYAVSLPGFRKDGQRRMTGTAGQKRVPTSFLEEYKIPVPPIPLQQKMASILQKAERLKEIREQANRFTSRLIESVFLKMFGNPNGGRMNFGKAPLADLVENLDSRRVPLNEEERSKRKGDIPYYGASGLVDWIDGFLFDEPLLLVAEDGENLRSRKLPIAYSVLGKSWVNNHAHVLRCFRINQRFLEFWFNLFDISPYLGGSTRPKLNKAKLMAIKVPLPPESLQEKFAGVVKKIDATRHHQAQSTHKINEVLNSLMDKAFRGELLT